MFLLYNFAKKDYGVIMKNKKIGIFVLVALLSLSNVVMASDSVDYSLTQEVSSERIKANKDTLLKVQDAIDAKDFQTAITLLTGYINEKPKRYDAYKLRGDAYYAIRRYDLAQEDFQTAVNLKSADDKLLTNTKYVTAIVLGADKNEQLQNAELGELYGALMYAQKAQNNSDYLNSYEKAVKYNSHIYLPQPNKNDINKINCPQKYGKILNPKGIDEKIYGAISDIENANYNEALYKLQSVTSEYPDYYLGYYLTGVALSELEKDDDAIQSFEKAAALNPFDFESYASLGQIYYSKAETTFSQDDARKSVDYFHKALRLNENCPTYYFYIGMNELQSGNTNVAIANFDKAIKINPNDYNSIYYKSIAQYINGKYQDVVDSTTKLLYRHVSNYNSVLYLRALAYTKLNQPEKALQDLDSIENNIEDIYNSDIKKTTPREKSLETYIHYLKAQIEHSKGAGAASDNSKAYVNPIINRLDNAKKAIAPYEKSLQGNEISLNDYTKFESFYSTSLPKLLESGAIITYEDIDNQYDYIRTTFDDLGISFLYTNPDYKMTTIKDYPYKKYSSKLSAQDRQTLLTRPYSDVKNVELAQEQDILRKSTPQSELIMQEGQQSLAQMLASNVVEENQRITSKQLSSRPAIEDTKLKEDLSKAEFKPETPDAEKINTSKNIASGEIHESQTPAVSSENNKKLNDILTEEKSILNKPVIRPETNIETTQGGNLKISVKNPVPSSDIEIKTAEKPLVTLANDASEKVANVVSKSDSALEPMVFKAEKIEQTGDIEIKYSQPKTADNLVNQPKRNILAARNSMNDALTTLSSDTEKLSDTAISSVENETEETNYNQSEIWKYQRPDAMRDMEHELQDIIDKNQPIIKVPKEIVEKHAKIETEELASKNAQIPFVIDDINDIVELDTNNLSQKINNNESDLFTHSTVFGPNVQKDVLPPVTLPEEPFIPEVPKSKLQNAQESAVETVATASEIEKKVQNTAQQVVVPEIRTNSEKVVTDAAEDIAEGITEQKSIVSEETENISEIMDKVIAQDEMKEEFTQIADTTVVRPVSEDVAVVESAQMTKRRLKEEAKLAKAQAKREKAEVKAIVKAEKLRLKEEAKLKKQQDKLISDAQKTLLKEQKAQIKEEKQKLKEEVKQVKEQLQEEKKLAKAQGQNVKETKQSWLKSKIANLHKKQSEADKIVKEQEKQAKKLAKAQAKLAEQKDETKIQRLKARLAQSKNNALTKEEKLAQKAQLKAERAAAREQYKAKQAAKKAAQKAAKEQAKAEKAVNNTVKSENKKLNVKNIFSKMKFWKKK